MTERPCPVCRRAPAAPAYRPFCSKRCADVDLQRWFAGSYAVAGSMEEGDGEDAGEAGRPRNDPL